MCDVYTLDIVMQFSKYAIMAYSRVFQLAVHLLKATFTYFFMLSTLSAQEIELSLAENKAHYTIEVVKQIEWPNEQKMVQFVIGIVGNDSELLEAFKQRSSIEVRNKPFKIEYLNDSNSVSGRYSVIFIPSNKRSLNKEISEKYPDALIIIEGRVSEEEHLVSLISVGDRMKVRLNRNNLTARGFRVSINLLEFAGTKEDLSEQLRAWEISIKELFDEVQAKETKLDALNAELKKNSTLLDLAEKKLSEKNKILVSNQQQLDKLSYAINVAKSEVEKNEQDITKQKSLVKKEKDDILVKEKIVTALRMEIDKSERILIQQNSRIIQQKQTIESKEETISEQRNWMMLIMIVSLVFFIMIYFLLKTNSLRRKANKELKNVNSQLFELATTDGLTQLYNRRYFIETAQHELLRQQRHDFHSVLLMIDIDFFKKVNDDYGHAMGDEAIRAVANMLKESMRKYDLVGRLGGEEYAMMLVDCDTTQANEIAIRLCSRVAQNKIEWNGLSINVTVSIGLSQLRQEDTDVAQLIVRADKALYQAKNAGRNRVVVFSDSK